MKIHKVHCLFEQSGTFKNAFKKMGIDAEDYDILNDFDQTDNVIDLFGEIDKAYAGEPSLFDNMGDCDLVFAFFHAHGLKQKFLYLSGESHSNKKIGMTYRNSNTP